MKYFEHKVLLILWIITTIIMVAAISHGNGFDRGRKFERDLQAERRAIGKTE